MNCFRCGHAQQHHTLNLTGDVLLCVHCQCSVTGLEAIQNSWSVFGAGPPVPLSEVAEQQSAAEPGTSPVEDCVCGHPRKVHNFRSAVSGRQDACMDPHCTCAGFESAASKVAAPRRCYICDGLAHATGACPYFPHRTPSRR